jgi:hypothetical protein
MRAARLLDALHKLSDAISEVEYGQLKLHPKWDSIRGDPRFEKIVASLAPKEASPQPK